MRHGLWKFAAVAGVAFVSNTGTAADALNTTSPAGGTVSSGSNSLLLAQSGVTPRKNYYNDLFSEKPTPTTPAAKPVAPATGAATGLPATNPALNTNNYADLFRQKPAPTTTAQAATAPAQAVPNSFYGGQPAVTQAFPAAKPQQPVTAAPVQPGFNQTVGGPVSYGQPNYGQANYTTASFGQPLNAPTAPAGQASFNPGAFAPATAAPAAAPAAPMMATSGQPFGQLADPAFVTNPFAAAPAGVAPQAAPTTAAAVAQVPQAAPARPVMPTPSPTAFDPAAFQPTPAQPVAQPAAAAVVAENKTFTTTPQVDAMQSTFSKFKASEPDNSRSLNYADYARAKNQSTASDVRTVAGTEATNAANSFLADPFMDQKAAPATPAMAPMTPPASKEVVAQPAAAPNPASDFTVEFLKKEAAATAAKSAAPAKEPFPAVKEAPRSNVTITRGVPAKQAPQPAPLAPPKSTFSSSVSTNREFASATLGGEHEAANGPQKPVVKIYWRKTSDFNIGRECTAELVVENQSQADAHDVEVLASFPTLVRLTDAKPAPEENGGKLLWRMGSLPAGKTQVIAIKMIPSQSGALNVAADVRFSASSASEFQVYEPMLAVEVAGPDKVMVGDPASHSVTISNPGTGITKDVKIEAVIPKGIEHPRGEKLLLDVGSLNPGETRTVRLALAATEGGDHKVVILASAESGLNAKAESIVHVVSPELTLNVDGPALRYMGRSGKYKIAVKNSGTIGSSNVRVMHKIPTGMQYVSADKGATYDSETRILSWFVGRLAPEASAEIEVELMAKEMGEYVHYIRASSEHGSQFDAQVATRVEGVSSLTLNIVDVNDPVEVGAPTSYEIVVKNDGSVDATNVAIACELPQGVQFISAQGPTDSLAEIDMILFRPLARLAPGETVVYKLNVKGLVDGNLRTRVRLASDSADQALTFEELTRFYGDSKK